MAIPDNYIDKITKGNDSRMISPAADMVRVNNDNFDGETLDEVLDDVYSKSEVDTKVAEAGSGAVSVTTNQNGTFTIHVGETDYTINLNHTHENMAKLIVCEESDLPSTLDPATIYAQVDDADTPTEIQSLWIAGLEFVGGSVPAGTPVVTKPSGTTINLGENVDGASKTVTIQGRDLTGDLTVTVGTGLSLTYNGTTASSVTIPLANALVGAQVTIEYGGTAALTDGSLSITGGGATSKTYTVTADAESLPSGYTQLEYVDNAVSGIDTGILATDSQDLTQSIAGSVWLVDVQCNSAPASNEMVVAANEDIAHWFGAIASTGCFGCGGTEYCFSSPATTRQQIQVAFFSNKIVLTSGGVTKTRNYTYPNKYNVCLLRNVNPIKSQYAGRQFTGRVYSIRCTSGGSFDAVPAQRTSDGAKGLYDKANQVFYPLT